MGFIIHFYIIFGTNLLTGGPVQIVVFLPISVFLRKGISNGMKPLGELFLEQTWSRGLGVDVKKEVRSPWGREARLPPGRAPTFVGPSQLHRPTSASYIYPYTPKTSRSTTNPISTAPTFCTHEIPYWGLFRRSAGGGIDYEGLLHQHHSLSGDVWVVYHRPSGP